MANFGVAAEALRSCLGSWRLWLIQFFTNALLFALFAAWLLVPVANAGYLVLNVLVALILFLAILVLHAGTLNYFSLQEPSLKSGFAAALRHLFAIVVCAGVVYLAWTVAGRADAHQTTLPAYLRSISPLFLRKLASLTFYQRAFTAMAFALRWILIPGLLLPFLASASRLGFRGFGPQGLAAWKKTVESLSYWSVVILSSLLGVLATDKIMGWKPDFRTSTYGQETVSLIFRLLISYLLGLFAWLLACSIAGREGGEVRAIPGHSSGQTTP